ncbi:MAG: hypothetical protein Q8K58_11190 [Acidimicrobiales bacterium]|nr:hypothetical protein [Acidimicrobiales bacterium]
MAERIDWSAVLGEAEEVVYSYSTGVTLRQLFYRLVAVHRLPNTSSAYKGLSSRTAEARRQGLFPDLIDRGREIHRYRHYPSPESALEQLARQYRRDRTEGQDVSLYIGVEKAGLVMQLQDWFGDLGIPILALGGYSSQTYVDEVFEDVSSQDRGAVLLYAGDFDPSGEDIDRDFVARTGCFDKVVRVALSAAQVEHYDLPPAMGKSTDSRASQFIERHGVLVQVELDALPPDVLEGLYRDAINEFWDESAWDAVVEQEAAERTVIAGASR